MDIRVLLVIAVFTVLFYHLFLEVTIYPAGGQTTDSQYDMPFYAELIESWGTSLPREDWSKLDEKRKELEEAYTRIIAADQVLADAKITNYQEFSKTQETFFDKDTLTDEEKKIDQELSRLVFEDSKGSKLFFELQVLDRLDEYKKLAVFWKGDCIDDTGLQLWCKNLPFGFYMLLYMLLVFVFVLAAVVLIYLIGRTAGNYIAGIAFAIPACAGIGFLLIHIFVHLFQKPMDENSLPYSEELWILGWILACACVLWWKMHRDHYRDL